jgi:hypothetical protein
LSDEEKLGMLMPIGGPPNEQAFRKAMQDFVGQRGTGVGGLSRGFPSEREIREHARRIASSYNVSPDFVEQIYPEQRPIGQPFGAYTPQLPTVSGGGRGQGPRIQDLSNLSDEDLERIARGGG